MGRPWVAWVALSLVAGGAVARAAPRVAVVVLSHDGLTEDEADEIASDVAVAVATQIEGEGIAGPSVRSRLPAGSPSEGCEEQPACGRELAAALASDEVLLLAMHVAGKTTVVACYRVPRDATRPPRERTMRIIGEKRAAPVNELATRLYPGGSVVPFAGAKHAVAAAAPEPETKARKHPVVDRSDDENTVSRKSSSRPRWFWPVIAGGAAVVVLLAVVLGVALGTTGSPTGPSVSLP